MVFQHDALSGGILFSPLRMVKRMKKVSSLSFNHPTFQGFSLTELVMVMGIVVILGLLSQTWLGSQLPKWRLNGAARQLVSDLMAAKMKAVTQGTKHRVSFLDSHRYTVLEDKNNNGKPDRGEPLVERDVQNAYGDVTLMSTNNPIFHPRGTASNLATVTVSNSAGTTTITVGITGRVKVKTS